MFLFSRSYGRSCKMEGEGVACRLGRQCQRGVNVGITMDTCNERIRVFLLPKRKEENNNNKNKNKNKKMNKKKEQKKKKKKRKEKKNKKKKEKNKKILICITLSTQICFPNYGFSEVSNYFCLEILIKFI